MLLLEFGTCYGVEHVELLAKTHNVENVQIKGYKALEVIKTAEEYLAHPFRKEIFDGFCGIGDMERCFQRSEFVIGYIVEMFGHKTMVYVIKVRDSKTGEYLYNMLEDRVSTILSKSYTIGFPCGDGFVTSSLSADRKTMLRNKLCFGI